MIKIWFCKKGRVTIVRRRAAMAVILLTWMTEKTSWRNAYGLDAYQTGVVRSSLADVCLFKSNDIQFERDS